MRMIDLLRRYWRLGSFFIVGTLVRADTAFAQPSPWENAATRLEATFTGTLARSLALVAIVVAGLMYMFGESGSKRAIAGVVFGGGLALMATTFLQWLFNK
jgi:type IV secretory pathway VirB2 component (pilin)